MTVSPLTAEIAWRLIASLHRKRIPSLSKGVVYEVRVTKTAIYYHTATRSRGAEEAIHRDDLIEAFDALVRLQRINTNTIKNVIPTKLYRKRSPLLALLRAAGVLVKYKQHPLAKSSQQQV